MKIGHKWAVVVATALGVAGYSVATRTSFARGGGGGHGGGHGGHEGGHHEGEHHASHHEGEHHPYHPTEHHMANHDHHDDHHHDDHHWNHHHHDWHYAGWGANPGFWGGLGLGYAAGWGWNGGWGGGTTYLGNPSDITTDTADNTANTAASIADNNDNSGDDNTQQAANGQEQYPVDVWPELGISTYSGEYGQSKGLVIVRVMPHSVADKAGLVPGDVILSYNGKPTPDDETLETILDSAKGDFSLSVWDARTGRKSVITGALEAPSNTQPEKTSS